jgi:hypothetical protein
LTRERQPRETLAPDPDHTPATGDDAKAFLGPLVNEFVVFVDDDRSVVKAFGIEASAARSGLTACIGRIAGVDTRQTSRHR